MLNGNLLMETLRTFDPEPKISPKKNIQRKTISNSTTNDIDDTSTARSTLKPVDKRLNKIKKLTTSKITMDLREKISETNKSIERMNSKFKTGKS